MKAICIFSFILAGLLTSGASLADEALARTKGCQVCHTIDKKLIGPTYKEIAQKFAGQKDAESRMATAITKGTPVPTGVGWQKEGKATLPFMPPNAAVKPEEAAKLAKWILGLK